MSAKRISAVIVTLAALTSCGSRSAVSTVATDKAQQPLITEQTAELTLPVPSTQSTEPPTTQVSPDSGLSAGFTFGNPKYQLVQLGVTLGSSSALAPAPPTIALYARKDGATIKVGGDAPQDALGKLLEVKPAAPLGPQATSVLMRYEKGSQVVVVSGTTSADEAVSLATSTADNPRGTAVIPPGFTEVAAESNVSSSIHQLSYLNGNEMLVLRFDKQSNDERVEFAQPSPTAWVQNVGARRVQINTTTGNSTIDLSWIEDGYLVSLVSSNDLQGSLSLVDSVSSLDATSWSQVTGDFTKKQLALPTISSAEFQNETFELHSDGSFGGSVCRLNGAESICTSSLDANPSLVAFTAPDSWEIVGILTVPGATVSVDGQVIKPQCDEMSNCWFAVTLPQSTQSAHLVATSSTDGGVANQLADIVVHSPMQNG